MPINGSFSSFSKNGFSPFTTTTLVGNQYVVSGAFGQMVVSDSGNVYFSQVYGSSTGLNIGKFNSNGNYIFAKEVTNGNLTGPTDPYNSFLIDSSENIFAAGENFVGNVSSAEIVKFDNSTGNISWQHKFPQYTGNANLNVVLTGLETIFDSTDNTLMTMITSSADYNHHAAIVKSNISTGATINQRDIWTNIANSINYTGLAYVQTFGFSLDPINNKCVATGFTNDAGGNSVYLIGTYNLTNTGNSNPVICLYTNYTSPGAAAVSDSSTTISDGTYYYTICALNEVPSPYEYSYVTKLNISNGAVVFNNYYSNSTPLLITELCLENTNNFIFITGCLNQSSGYCYLAKIRADNGNIVWQKQITVSSVVAAVSSGLYWKNGYVYATYRFESTGDPTIDKDYLIKIKDNGTVVGTYGNLIISDASCSVTNNTSYFTSVNILNDTTSNITLGSSNSSMTTVALSSSYFTTTIIP